MNKITVEMLDSLIFIYQDCHFEIEPFLNFHTRYYANIKQDLIKLDILICLYNKIFGVCIFINIDKVNNYKRILKLKSIINE